VGNCVVVAPLVHCTTEHGTRFVPVTVIVAPAAPAVAVAGRIPEIVGAGSDAGETVNAVELERTPKFET
jgi:hypothetical protein